MIPPRVLLALNESERRSLLCARLIEEGCLVAVVNGGLACLEALRSSPPDVLILESALLWGGGDGVLAYLREDLSLPTIPVMQLLSRPSGVGESVRDGFRLRILTSEVRQRAPGLASSEGESREFDGEECFGFVRFGEIGGGRPTAADDGSRSPA